MRTHWLPIILALGCSSPPSTQQATPPSPPPPEEVGDDDAVVEEDAPDAPEPEDVPQKPATPSTCTPGSKPGSASGAEHETTPGGLGFNVRVPKTYRAEVASPLIVVYAPAGADGQGTEDYTNLTPPSFARGYLLAYVDHTVAKTGPMIKDAATVASRVSSKWCVDQRRIYLTGHSDGGTMAIAVAVNSLVPLAAIAPSAAGADPDTLKVIPCAKPLAAMILHSANDGLFPKASGIAQVEWFAKCASCTSEGAPLPDGCVPRMGCADGADVQYCEGKAPHAIWPDHNRDILDFFDAHKRP